MSTMTPPAGTAYPLPPPKRRRRWLRVTLAVAVAGLAMLAVLRACSGTQPESVTIVAAGDMACDLTDPAQGSELECQAQAVSDMAVELHPYAFIGLGDYLYELPTSKGYQDVYGPSWGRLLDRTFPVLGNQEYKVHEANTFRTYFGDRAGPQDGYYSTQIGQWHVVFLNSNCKVVTGGCAMNSPQQKWLAADLAANTAQCTMAVWHHPRWSNGIAGSDQRLTDLYQTLLDNQVDILLSGHEADYERFGPLAANGQPDPAGVRQFVVGTGGQVTYDPAQGDAPWRAKAAPIPNEFFDGGHHGLLRLTLNPDSYDWQFIALDAGVLDSGSAPCHPKG